MSTWDAMRAVADAVDAELAATRSLADTMRAERDLARTTLAAEVDAHGQTKAALAAEQAAHAQTRADLEACRATQQPEPRPRPLPVYCSPSGSGSAVANYRARIEGADQWATGFYAYWPGDIGPFNAAWRQMTEAYPDGLPVLGSPKGDPTLATGRNALTAFFTALPAAWRAKFICAYWQEPEDNFVTAAERATYRARVAAMADTVRPLSVRSAVHLQEWALNPQNSNTWVTPNRGQRLAEFVTGIEGAVDYVSWSCYSNQGQSMDTRIARIKAWCEQYLPGKPWGITAAGIPVSATDGSAARATRAALVREAANLTVAAGGQAFGWFDHDGFNEGRDQLASKDSALRAALAHAAGLTLP